MHAHAEAEATASVPREATTADIPALVALVNSAYRGDSSRQGWTTEADLLDGQRIDAAGVRDLLDSDGTVILVLESDEALLACCELNAPTDDTGVAYFGMLTVNPTAQGKGIGHRVLAAAEEYAARQWAARRMRMWVLSQRSALIAWYGRRGYRPNGVTAPFPYGDERFGIPRRDDLAFVELCKDLPHAS